MVVLRSSSLLLLALMASGCILAEPGEHSPTQTAPILNLGRAIPAITQVLRVDGDTVSQTFTVPVISEDVGEVLLWSVQRNYELPTADEVASGTIEASHLGDTTRKISFEWGQGFGTDPCYQLTLFVCHFGNFDFKNPPRCIDDEDTALATWWVNYGDVTADPTLSECPGPIADN